MKKEQLSTSTQEVPKVKLAFKKNKRASKNEKKNNKTYQKKNHLNYQNQLDGDF